MNTHTQAPWRIRCETNSKGVKRYWIYGPIKNAPAHARAFNEADARLIAAAPDLLVACKAACVAFEFYAISHQQKCTPEGDRKARENERLANVCRATIDKAMQD